MNEFDRLTPEQQEEVRERVKRRRALIAATITPQQSAAFRTDMEQAAAHARWLRYMSQFDPIGPPV